MMEQAFYATLHAALSSFIQHKQHPSDLEMTTRTFAAGDIIICKSHGEAGLMRNTIKANIESQKTVERILVVVAPTTFQQAVEALMTMPALKGLPCGHIVFSDGWLHEYFHYKLIETVKDVGYLRSLVQPHCHGPDDKPKESPCFSFPEN